MTPELTHLDMQTIVFAVWRAARREPEISRRAIAWSVRNRIVSHGHGEPGCVVRHCGDLLREVADSASPAWCNGARFGERDYCQAFATSCQVWCDDLADPTGGANRFHRHDAVPAWAAALKPVALLGSYFFYCEPAAGGLGSLPVFPPDALFAPPNGVAGADPRPVYEPKLMRPL